MSPILAISLPETPRPPDESVFFAFPSPTDDSVAPRGDQKGGSASCGDQAGDAGSETGERNDPVWFGLGTRTASSPSPMGNRRGTRGLMIEPSSAGIAGMGAVGAS